MKFNCVVHLTTGWKAAAKVKEGHRNLLPVLVWITRMQLTVLNPEIRKTVWNLMPYDLLYGGKKRLSAISQWFSQCSWYHCSDLSICLFGLNIGVLPQLTDVWTVPLHLVVVLCHLKATEDAIPLRASDECHPTSPASPQSSSYSFFLNVTWMKKDGFKHRGFKTQDWAG